MRGSDYGFYFISSSKRQHGHHHHHPYMRSEKKYLEYQFNKPKPPTFDEYVKKLEDEDAWLLGMKKFLKLHGYIENMKAKITIFKIKGKEYIWWGNVKSVRGI